MPALGLHIAIVNATALVDTTAYYLLLESGDYFLLENGDKLIL